MLVVGKKERHFLSLLMKVTQSRNPTVTRYKRMKIDKSRRKIDKMIKVKVKELTLLYLSLALDLLSLLTLNNCFF